MNFEAAVRLLLPRRDSRRFPLTGRRAAIALVAAIGAAACDGGSDVADQRVALERQRQQLLNQFASAQNRIRRTQAQALGDPSLVPLRERFYERLRETMIEIDPRAEGWLDRARALGPEIDVLSRPQFIEPGEEPVSLEEQRAVVERFAALEDSLKPVQDRALAEPDVAEAFNAFQDSLHAVMLRINPSAATALEQMRRTSAAVDSIDAELRSLPEP